MIRINIKYYEDKLDILCKIILKGFLIDNILYYIVFKEISILCKNIHIYFS